MTNSTTSDLAPNSDAGFVQSFRCLKDRGLTRTDIAVFGAYKFRANLTGISTVSCETLAREAQCSVPSVKRATGKLKSAGVINVKAMGRRDGQRGRGSNKVTINWDHPWLAPICAAEIAKATELERSRERQALRREAMKQFTDVVNPDTYARRWAALAAEGHTADEIAAVMPTTDLTASLDDVRALCKLEREMASMSVEHDGLEVAT